MRPLRPVSPDPEPDPIEPLVSAPPRKDPPQRAGRPLAVAVLLAVLLTAGLSGAQPQDPVQYSWLRQFYGKIGDADALLYSDSFRHAKLAFGDLNGDGVAELLVGTEDGRVARFDNKGTPQAPVWQLGEESLAAGYPEHGPSGARLVTRPIHVAGHAAPALVDLDGDGDLDLIVGSVDGHLAYFRNVGTPLLPTFEFVTDTLIPVGLGEYLVPAAVDLNGDQAPDLVIGTAAGDVYLLMNSGTRRNPAFCGQLPAPDEEPPCHPAPKLAATVRPEIRAAPALADWSGNGLPELFVGMANGTIAYFANRGTDRDPQWVPTQPKFLAIREGGYAAPAFLPIAPAAGPGVARPRPDLYVGTSVNSLSIYTAQGLPERQDAWKITANALRIGSFGRELERPVVTVGDVDGDGDLDLLVGERNGAVYWIENVGTAKSPAWRMHPRPIVPESPRGYSAPLLADLDGDGDLDLLVGGGDGKLWFLRNLGTPKAPRWQLESTAYANIDVGSGSIPAVADIDGDGDLDLFVGNSRGLVIFYRNEGTAQNPDFRLASTRFGDVAVGQAAAPTFFDWNEDKLPDLVIGNREGRLALVVNENSPGDPQPRKWKTLSMAWEGFLVRTFSAPVFGDFNGDGKPDLLIADGQGNLRLYLQVGIERPTPPAETAAASPGAAIRETGGRGVASSVAPPVPPKGTPSAQGKAPGSSAPALQSAAGGPGTGQDDQSGEADAARTIGPQPPVYTFVSDQYAGIKVEGRAVPTFGDLDGDGDLDLLVGTGKGQVLFYRNTGTKQAAKWEREDAPIELPVGRNASILLVDLDGDGLLDLLVGSEDGHVAFYKNTGTQEAPKFARQDSSLAGIAVGRNAAPGILPLEQDPAGQLVVGNFAGTVFLYVRDGAARSLNFKLRDRRFLGRSFGVSATPFGGDADGDGVPDLLIGSDSGAITHYTLSGGNAGGAGTRGSLDGSNPSPPRTAEPSWKPGEDYFKGLKLPLGVTPRLADIDGDGNADLFVGTEKGTILFYANRAASTAQADKVEGK